MVYSEQQWNEAKTKCRLNDEELAIAKRLGINPKSLIKNIPNNSEPWKAPVKDWLHELARKKSEQKKKRKEQAAKKESQT